MKTKHHRSTRTSRLLSLMLATSLCVVAGTAVLAQSTKPASEATASPQDLVNSLHAAFGDHHVRAVHAKGTILQGSFKPSESARSLSKESIFAGGELPLTARFSDFTGIPDIPDNINDANPRGFAFRVQSSDGDAVDVVSHSFNGFPVATSDDFAALMQAIGGSGAGVAHPNPIEQFLGAHPIAKAFLTTQKAPPVSYATAAYFGVNSFKFTNASGKAVFVRYRLVPRAGEHYLSADELKAKGPDYLQDEIGKRANSAKVVFDWYAQIAQDGDKIEDPSVAWPDTRKLVKLGTITIDRLVPDQAGVGKALMFLPGTAHPGIDPADPMLIMRNASYPISHAGRQ